MEGRFVNIVINDAFSTYCLWATSCLKCFMESTSSYRNLFRGVEASIHLKKCYSWAISRNDTTARTTLSRTDKRRGTRSIRANLSVFNGERWRPFWPSNTYPLICTGFSDWLSFLSRLVGSFWKAASGLMSLGIKRAHHCLPFYIDWRCARLSVT